MERSAAGPDPGGIKSPGGTPAPLPHGSRPLPGGPPTTLASQRSDLVLFACGDPAHAEHESVAIAAATTLPPQILERVDLKLVGPMRPEYLRDLTPGTYVVIADTLPGTPEAIVEIALLDLVGREQPFATSSTHEQPLDEVLAMAQLLRDEPLVGHFVGLRTDAADLTAPPRDAAVVTLREALARTLAAFDD